jgi:hypothetical protein
MEQPILVALIALGSAILTVTIPRLFSKKKDAVEMYSEIHAKLYSEIERLEKKINILEQKEEQSYLIEEKLTKRIAELEQENLRQAIEIERLKVELKQYVKQN